MRTHVNAQRSTCIVGVELGVGCYWELGVMELRSLNAHAPSQPESDLRTALETFLEPDQILDREIDRIAYASDASFYRLRAARRPAARDRSPTCRRSSRSAARERIPMTFRGAGTSLSGQAVTDGLLVDVSRHWRHGRAARRRPARARAAGRDRRARQPRARAVLGAHRPRPGVDRRLHDGRHPLQQLERDVLRRLAEQLPDARVAALRPAVRHRRRHRRRRTPPSGSRAAEPAIVAGLAALRDRVQLGLPRSSSASGTSTG